MRTCYSREWAAAIVHRDALRRARKLYFILGFVAGQVVTFTIFFAERGGLR